MKNHQLKLIDSTYPAKDAKEILFDLISHKIHFINQQLFSLNERFGTTDKHLERRIGILQKEKTQLIEWLNTTDDDCPVKLDCELLVEIKETESIAQS